MCIKKIDAYTDSKGGVFTTERCAIESEIGIITGMTHDDVLTLIGKASPLVPLLQRVLSIAPPKSKDEKPSAEPARTPTAAYERRASLIGRCQNWAQINKASSRDFLKDNGFDSLTALNNGATDLQIERMHADLDEAGVAK